MARSVVAVVAGYVLFTASNVAAHLALGWLFPHAFADPFGGSIHVPQTSGLVLLLIFHVICAVTGGYVTALLSRQSVLEHTVALGILMVCFDVATMFVIGDQRSPLWYRACFTAISLPAAVAGGYLRLNQMPQNQQAA